MWRWSPQGLHKPQALASNVPQPSWLGCPISPRHGPDPAQAQSVPYKTGQLTCSPFPWQGQEWTDAKGGLDASSFQTEILEYCV